jgi:hypothetical protein
MNMTSTNEKNFRIYEALAHEDAMAAADRRELTPELQLASARIYESMRAQIADAERATRRSRVRPSILAMTRDAITQRLAALFDAHPGAVFAHRDLTAMSDHDLRTALEDAESLAERAV